MKLLSLNKKLNKKGSTIIMVLIMCSFVMILASAITSTVMLNLRMKMAKSNLKSTFYTAEEAVDEIYVSLGKVSMDSFNAAYVDELTHISANRSINLDGSISYITNNYANERLRKNYMTRLLSNLSIISDSDREGYLNNIYSEDNSFSELERELNVVEKEKLTNRLRSYLEEDVGKLDVKELLSASVVVSNEEIEDEYLNRSNIENYYLKITDLTVSYLNKQGYTSEVTIDINIGFPQETVALIENELEGRTNFANYAFIANEGILVSGRDDNKVNTVNKLANPSTLNLYGSVYGGGSLGIRVNNGANFNIYGNDSTNVISGKDLVVNGGSVNANGGRIWTNNIFTTLSKSSIYFQANSHIYAKDDLELRANDSNVNINGDYYGYGYVATNGGGHESSSSLIINSNNSKININSSANVLLSGNAYITYNEGAIPYETGFSYASYGDQESYLVPSAYISSKVNPVPLLTEAIYNTAGNTGRVSYEGKNVEVSLDNSFFAYPLLDEEKPFILKVLKSSDGYGSAYYYLNFKNSALKAVYAKLIEDDEAYLNYRARSTYYNNATTMERENYDNHRNSLHDTLNINSASTKSDIFLSPFANMDSISDSTYDLYNNGVNMNGDNISLDYSNYQEKYTNYAIRYNILRKILYPVENPDTLYLKNEDVGKDNVPDVSLYSDNVFLNFVSMEGFRQYIANRGVSAHNYGVNVYGDYMLAAFDNEGVNGKAVVIDSSLSKSNYKGMELKTSKGVIVATGDVVVRSNFTGVILSKGKITVEGNVRVTSLSESEILNMINSDTGVTTEFIDFAYPFKSIFLYGFEKQNTENKGNPEMSYKDMVEISNWRY